jgi:hypothetical protein
MASEDRLGLSGAEPFQELQNPIADHMRNPLAPGKTPITGI